MRAPVQQKNIVARKERQDRFLALIKEGHTVLQACEAVGVKRQTYHFWRRTFPEFKSQMTWARNEEGSQAIPEHVTFTAFRKRFLHMETYRHQQAVIEMLEHLAPGQIGMVNLPPEAGKSTLLEDWIVRTLCFDPDHRITVVSESIGHARKMLSRVKSRLTDHARYGDLLDRYGPFYQENQERQGKPWSRDFITVARSSNEERDYSVEARGWTSRIYGTRVDTLLVDDIQSMGNLNQTKELVRKFRQDFISRVGKNGRILIVGTRVGENDFYDTLDCQADRNGNSIVRRYIKEAAIQNGESYCPEMWPLEALLLKQDQVDEEVWACCYQQNPRASSNVTFTQEMLDGAKNPLRRAGFVPEQAHGTILGLDPALGGGNALVALSYGEHKIYLVDCVIDHHLGTEEQILSRLTEFFELYRPGDLVVEANAYQKALAYSDRLAEIAASYGCRVHPHETNVKTKYDPTFGIGRIPLSFERDEFDIPDADEPTRRRIQPWIDEMLAFRVNMDRKHRRDDLVLATWFAWMFVRQRQAFMAVDQGVPIITRSMPYRPTAYTPLRSQHREAVVLQPTSTLNPFQ